MAKLIPTNGRGSKDRLTQKDLAIRWGVVLRTVQRRIRESKLEPVFVTGIQPVFALKDVEAYEKKRAALWGRKQALFRRFGKLAHAKKKRTVQALNSPVQVHLRPVMARKRGVM